MAIKVDRIELSAGGFHTCFIVSKSSKLVCWGDNRYNQTHVDIKQINNYPIKMFKALSVKFVSLGQSHTCFVFQLDDRNNLFCYGNGQDGQTDIPDEQLLNNIIYVSSGGFFTCAISMFDENNKMFCFGQNDQGQIEVPNVKSIGSNDSKTNISKDQQLTNNKSYEYEIESNDFISLVVAGGYHACLIKCLYSCKTKEASILDLLCWGDNRFGQSDISTFDTIIELIQTISLGDRHTCFLQDYGLIKCIGSNHVGQLIIFDNQLRIPLIKNVSTGANNTCVILLLGQVKCVGWNKYLINDVPNLNNGNNSKNSEHIEKIAVGDIHACDFGSKLNCWGSNKLDQCELPMNL